ncbi:alanine/ornithine racemase family PLP-dependent enzyme [[Limnothrix rosea] IAM M-220]|uniref:alanine/ornithine racemase family PLP-dependent enzyme n=1 Tax=[Limnothrix rosea] IAM M-220 TaxID=454133 RepID=UPI001F2E61F5|nr:alanine/ornithine racemase family PLP-dependent enzyme [[Limnothrix rosea] IAM M-220]
MEIDLSKIRANTRILADLYGAQGISIMGVSKAVLGEPAIIEAMVQGGVKFIADSRLENIQRMQAAGISTDFVLLRTAPSQAELIVEIVDISLNSELETIRKIAYYAGLSNKIHRIILMVELGDRREGILPCDLAEFIGEVLKLSQIKLVGLGCNLACYGGIKPDDQNMHGLSEQVELLERKFLIDFSIVSGGNSANYDWYKETQAVGRVNNLRLGESIFLGCETVYGNVIPGLQTKAFQLVAEVIESKKKPSLPFGEICRDAFGNVPIFQDQGIHQRSIIALGKQDTLVSGLSLDRPLKILGSSSDHLILDSGKHNLQVGDAVNFSLNYGSLLRAMTSPFIRKQFMDS